MKIIFFASSLGTGVTVLLTEHICALAKQPDIELVAVAGPGAQEPYLEKRILAAGVRLIRIDGLDQHQEACRLLRELSGVIHDVSPDIIMVQTNWQLVLTRFACWKAGVHSKITYWIHGYRHNSVWKSKLALPIIGLLLRFCAHRAIASSKIVLQKFSPWVGKKKMCFLPLGVDQIFFDTKNDEKSIPPPMKLIFAGQFREGKQQDWIIRAVAQCRNDGYKIEAVLPGEGPQRKDVMKLAKELEVSDIISFPGNITKSELINCYHKATLGIVSSNNETFGSCIAEPMVCGLPLLTRPVGCARDLICDGVNGLFFTTERDLVQKLQKLIDNPEEYLRIRKNANKSASYFDWNRICKDEYNMFQNLEKVKEQ